MKVLTKYRMRMIRGVCAKCNKPRVTKSLCEEHRIKHRNQARVGYGIPLNAGFREYINGRKRLTFGNAETQKLLGLCLRCNSPAVTKKFCEDHRREANLALQDYKRRRKGLAPVRLSRAPVFKSAPPVCRSLDKHLSGIFFGYEPKTKEKPVSARQRRTGKAKTTTQHANVSYEND